MTVLTGTFVDVADRETSGRVTFSVEKRRSAYAGTGVIVTTQRHTIPLVDGTFTSPELDPGPLTVEVEAPGYFEQIAVVLPDDGTHDLHDLLEAAADYDPPVVGRAEDAARRSRQFAEDSAGHADRAEEQRRQVDQVVADGAAAIRQHVSEDADRAVTAASNSEDSAKRSADAQSGAETARSGAETARDEAETKAETAAAAAATRAAVEEVAKLVLDAPEDLDTIYELAAFARENREGIGAIVESLERRVRGAFTIVVSDSAPAPDAPTNQITLVRGP